MYSNNKYTNSYDNSITVTPIKSEDCLTQSYPNSGYIGGSVAAAATTSIQHRSSNQNASFVIDDSSLQSSYSGPTTSDSTSFITNLKEAPTPKGRSRTKNTGPRKPPPTLDNFWVNIIKDVNNIQGVDAKHQCLPLARIKKIMKLDENAKMIAAEAPLLFAKACEYFIQELTMRAWIHTEENKRRTLQRTDIAQAIANYDQFDFLIDIVPREEIRFQPKSQKEEKVCNTSNQSSSAASSPNPSQVSQPTFKQEQADVSNIGTVVTPMELCSGTQQQTQQQQHQQQQQQQQQQQPQQVQIIQHPGTLQPQQMQYFITLPGQQSGQAQIVQQLQVQPNQLSNGITPQITGLNLVAQQPQQLILTAGPNGQLTAQLPASATAVPQQQILLQGLAQQQQQQQQQQQMQPQQIQILQQVIGPNGEIQNVPVSINANQLNMLRLQMQQQQQQQNSQQQMPQQVNILYNPTQQTTATVAQLQNQNQNNNIATFRPNC